MSRSSSPRSCFSARGQMATSPQLHTLPTLSLSGRTLPSGLGQ